MSQKDDFEEMEAIRQTWALDEGLWLEDEDEENCPELTDSAVTMID